MEQTKTLSDTRSGRSPICISVTVSHSETWPGLACHSGLQSVRNKISLESLNCGLIATSLFLWSDQDSSPLPGIEMFPVMTCLAFLILPSPCPAHHWPNNKNTIPPPPPPLLILPQPDCHCCSRHGVSLVPGAWGPTLVIVMVRNLDNFSNSLEQISCENKPVGENWKFIISYQWFSLSQQCGVITRWCVSCLLSSWLMPLIKCDNHNS